MFISFGQSSSCFRKKRMTSPSMRPSVSVYSLYPFAIVNHMYTPPLAQHAPFTFQKYLKPVNKNSWYFIFRDILNDLMQAPVLAAILPV